MAAAKTEKPDELLLACEWGAPGEQILALIERLSLTPDEPRCQRGLVMAASKGHVETAQALLKFGVPTTAKGSDGQFALQAAAECGKLETVKLLCIAGAKVEQPDSQGIKAMNVAIKEGHMPVVKELIRYGATVKSSEKAPGLVQAMHEAKIEVLVVHLKSKVDAHVDPNEYKTADEAVWKAMRAQMVLIRQMEEQKAGTTIIESEKRLAVEREQAAKAKEEEDKLAAELDEKKIALQSAQTDISNIGKELDDVIGQQFKLKDAHDKMSAEYKAISAELKEAQKLRDEADAALSAKQEHYDSLVAQVSESESAHAKAQSKNDQLKSDLEAVRKELADWRKDQERAARLTAKAQSLLGHVEPDTPP